MRSLRLLSVLTLALLVAGCGAPGANTLAKYTHNTQPLPPTEAPKDGQYALYSLTDVTPQAIYPCRKGDKLGFINRDGQIYAVAGSREVPIRTTGLIRSWEWRKVER